MSPWGMRRENSMEHESRREPDRLRAQRWCDVTHEDERSLRSCTIVIHLVCACRAQRWCPALRFGAAWESVRREAARALGRDRG